MKSLNLSTTEVGALVIELLKSSGLLVVEKSASTEIFITNEDLEPFKEIDPCVDEQWEQVKPYLMERLHVSEYAIDARRHEVVNDIDLIENLIEGAPTQEVLNIEFYQIICSPFVVLLNIANKEEGEEFLAFPEASPQMWNHLASTIQSLLSGARNGIITYSFKGEYKSTNFVDEVLFERMNEWFDDAMDIRELPCLLSFQSIFYSLQDREMRPRIELSINAILGLIEADYIRQELSGRDYCQMMVSFFEIVVFNKFEEQELESIIESTEEPEYFELKSI